MFAFLDVLKCDSYVVIRTRNRKKLEPDIGFISGRVRGRKGTVSVSQLFKSWLTETAHVNAPLPDQIIVSANPLIKELTLPLQGPAAEDCLTCMEGHYCWLKGLTKDQMEDKYYCPAGNIAFYPHQILPLSRLNDNYYINDVDESYRYNSRVW